MNLNHMYLVTFSTPDTVDTVAAEARWAAAVLAVEARWAVATAAAPSFNSLPNPPLLVDAADTKKSALPVVH